MHDAHPSELAALPYYNYVTLSTCAPISTEIWFGTVKQSQRSFEFYEKKNARRVGRVSFYNVTTNYVMLALIVLRATASRLT
jgi:hypothetical protein